MSAYLDGGQWRWRRQIRLADGTRVRGSGTPPINTKRSALMAEHDWIETTLAGRRAPPAAPTLAAVQVDYLAHLRLHRSPSLLDNRTSTFKVHLIPAFGRTRLDRITAEMVDRYKAEKVEAELEPSTINGHLQALTNAMRFAQRRGLVREVPSFEPLPTTSETDELEYLTDAQVDQLLARADGELRRMVIAGLHTGMRVSELLALKWTDLDLRLGRVTVRHNVYRGKDRPPKGKKTRSIPLSRAAVAALREQKHLRGPLVFCEDDGRLIRYGAARDRIRRLGVVGWHVLRHTFGTTLAARGVPLRAIQEWMGHASIRTTMIYAHFSPVMDAAIHVLDGETYQPRANYVAGTTESGGKSGA